MGEREQRAGRGSRFWRPCVGRVCILYLGDIQPARRRGWAEKPSQTLPPLTYKARKDATVTAPSSTRAHARSLQAFPDDLAARLRRTAADVPAVASVGRVVRAMPVVREVADQLPQLLPRRRRSAGRQRQRLQVRQQRLAPLLVQDSLGLGLPLHTRRLVVAVPDLGEVAQVFGGVIPVQDRPQGPRPGDAAMPPPTRCRRR